MSWFAGWLVGWFLMLKDTWMGERKPAKLFSVFFLLVVVVVFFSHIECMVRMSFVLDHLH